MHTLTSWAEASVPIYRIGSLVHTLLAPGSQGRVLAASSSAIYLTSNDHDLSWLTTKASPMHRRSMQVAACLPRVMADSAFTVVDRLLVFDAHLVLDFSRALDRPLPRPYPKVLVPITDLANRLCAVWPMLADLPSPTGFGILLPYIAEYVEHPVRRRPLPALPPAPRFAWPVVQAMIDAGHDHDFPLLLQHAEALIGLGEGLTPSGDDFIGGLLFCLSTLKDSCGLSTPLLSHDLVLFMQRSKLRTNLISYTLLRDHAEGHATDVLHRLMSAMLSGQVITHIPRLIDRLVHIGHSTGWDLLAGVLTGMLVSLRFGAVTAPSSVRAFDAH
jgi:hypothetical protein